MRDGFVKVAALSPSLKVCDVSYNKDRICEAMQKAEESEVSLLVLPELALTGYTAADLFLQPRLIDACLRALEDIIKESKGKKLLLTLGLPFRFEGKLYNTAAVVYSGKLLALIPKTNLPSYGEFYEVRWFTPAFKGVKSVAPFGYEVPFGTDIIIKDKTNPSFRLAIEICEDLWVPSSPSLTHTQAGATVIANLSASDEIIGKEEYRRSLVTLQSAKLVCGYIYADAGIGESTTDMVFIGHNIICENGSILNEEQLEMDKLLLGEIDTERIEHERCRMNTYSENNPEGYCFVEVDLGDRDYGHLDRLWARFPFVPYDEKSVDERARKIPTLQALGLRKRVEHTNAKSAVIGLSGGLDSTLALLVTVVAFDMLKKPRKEIIAITMPCFGTTKRTRSNAELLAVALGVSFKEIDITKSVYQHFEDIGQDKEKLDVTYENGQARERTQVLMDVANQSGGLVIGTGDLSELALGWATYNGDHMSMYGVNSSIPKTLVRYLVKWFADQDYCGSGKVLYDILDTPVSPELLPASEDGTISQKTEDLVGPYELHDFFLYYFVRCAFAPDKIKRIAYKTFEGKYSADVIDKWLSTFIRRFFSQQFKRSCLPDGPKVGSITLSPRSDWRMPSDAVAALWLE